MKLAILIIMCIVPAQAIHISLTDAASVTTIAINVLEIKENIAKVRAASRATKRVIIKTAKKVKTKVSGK